MQLYLNVLVFNIWLPKGEKSKKMKEGTGHLNPLDIISARGGRAYDSGRRYNTARTHQEGTSYEQGRGFSPKYNHADTLILDFPTF